MPPDHILDLTVNLLKLAPLHLPNHLECHQLLLRCLRVRGSTSLYCLLEALSDITLNCEIVLKDCGSSWMLLEERSDIVLDSLVDNLIHLI